LFARADILSLHLPLTGETKHFVNAARLAGMKPTAIVVNTARGPLIDTVALAQALQAGVIAGAGLDVFEQEPLPADHPLRAAAPPSGGALGAARTLVPGATREDPPPPHLAPRGGGTRARAARRTAQKPREPLTALFGLAPPPVSLDLGG